MSIQADDASIQKQPCALCRRREIAPRQLKIARPTDPQEIAQRVDQYPPNVASESMMDELFSSTYQPGTFLLAERKEGPDFLDPGEPEFATFIKQMVDADLSLLCEVGILVNPCPETRAWAAKTVLDVLEIPLQGGTCLSERTMNQEATDTVWRILKLLIFGNIEEPLHTHERQNSIGAKVALQVIKGTPTLDLHTLAKRSVISGLIGTNLKETTKLVGPSKVLGQSPFVLRYEADVEEQACEVQRVLSARTDSGLALDCWEWYRTEVLERSGPVKLAFCTDDYVETLFDLHFIQAQMLTKEDLSVTIVPRNGRYANDACHCDVSAFLKLGFFEPLHTAQEQGHLAVCQDGPVMGGINGRKLSPSAAEVLSQADVVVVKGARAYEMLQGIKKHTYFAFNIARSYSESITGIEAEQTQGVFVRPAPGVPSFSGFRSRGRRKHRTSTGREMMLAEMTASEYVRALDSKQYAEVIAAHAGNEEEATRHILQEATLLGTTFADVVAKWGQM